MALTYDELYGIQNQYNKKVTEATKKTTKSKSSSSSSSSKQYAHKLIENNIAPYKVVSRNVNSGFIAPITKLKTTVTTSTKKKKEDDRTWFKKSSYFDDGYDLGDITKTILGTVADVGEDISTGIIGMGEKALDSLMTLGTAMNKANTAQANFNMMSSPLALTKKGRELSSGLITQSNAIQKETEKYASQFVAKDLYDEEQIAKQIISAPIKSLTGMDVESASVFGEKTDSLVQSGGQLLATAGLQAIGVPWFLTTGATSFGAEAEGAFREGATFEQGTMSAAISAGAEILSEKLSGGIKFGGNTLDDVLLKPLTEKITNKVAKVLVNLGVDAVGEGFEEVFSGVISNLGSALYKEESISELLASEEALDEYLESFIGGMVLGGVSSTASEVANRNAIQLDEKSQTVVDKVVEALIEQEKQKGNKVSKSTEKNIRKAVINNLNKGYLDKDSIYREFGGEEYENYKKAKELSESNISSGKQVIKNLENAKKKLQKEYDALYKMKNGDKSDEQIDRQNQIKEQIANIEAEIEKTTGVIDKLSNDQKLSDLEAKLDANVYELIKDSKLAETFREGDRRGETFKADLTKYDSKQQATIKSAIESGILNNSNRTHDFVDMVAKISADKGITFDFVNNEKIKASGFAIDGKTVNGYKTEDGKIVVNIESSKSLDSIVGHEIAHILEGTELYAELQEAVKAYATTKGEYESRLQALRELYEGVYKGKDFDDKIRAELTADIIGEYLFTDADFVNRLSAEKPNIFKKIYDEIKYLCNVATAGSKEARELEKLKHQFEKAYKESAKGNVTGTKYSIKKTSQMDYSNQLEMIEKGKLNGSNSLYIGIPSNQLQSIGFSEKPFAMNQGDYRKSRRASAKNKNYSSHAVPYDFFENMPQYLADAPLIEDNGEKATVITSYEMLDTKGNDSYVIAGVWKDQTMESDTVNQVKSVYPLDDFIHQITEAAEVGKLVCINKNKAEQMLATIGIQPAEVSRILNLSKDILPQNSEKSSGNVDYSLNETDSKYLSAVKSGDTETAQKMVDEAAKENGYDSPVLYHGTHSFGFTNFDLDKMDDKRSIFLTSSKEIASTYSGVTGSKEIGKDNTVNVADMSAEDIVKRLNEYDAEFKTGTTEGPHNYELYDFKKTNSLISKVNDGIEKLKGIVGEEIKSYVDKMARDFDDKDAKIHRQLVTLSERLDRYDYQNLSTPIYLLLHHTDVFGGSAEIAELEKNIRLMNQVRTRDLSAGVIVDEALGGYVIEIMEIDQARDYLENRLKAGNYSLYARLGKALEIDGKGALWKDIRNWTSAIEVKPADVSVVKKGDFYELVDKNTNEVIEGGSFAVNSYTDELALTNKDKLRSLMVNNTNYILRINTETMNTTRAIAKFAKERGYDSVVFKNIRDNGGWNSEVGYDEVADIYVIFDEKSVKSADAVTYDDNGEVIPLSERFNSENNDIRYSLSEDVDNVEKILYDKNNSLSIVNRAKTNNNSSLKWVYDSEIFSVEESKLFHEKISEINQGSEAFSKNSAGEYMIPIENKIIFTDGNYDSPYVREIVEVLTEYQTEYDDIRERIYNVEKGKSDKYETAQTLAKVYGNGIVVTHRNGISGVYGWENGKRKGKSRSSVIRNHLNKQLRRRDDRKSKETQINEIAPINEASSKDGVFFDGEKTNDPDVNFSLSEEGTIPPKKGRFFGRDVMYQPSDIAPRNVSASSATDDIAPVQESVAQNEGIVNEADFAPIKAQQGVEPTPISGVQKEATPTESNDVEEKPTRRSELHQNIVDRLKGKFKEKGFDFDEVLKQAKNLSTFATVDNIPQRVIEKALGYKQGQILADETVNKVAQNESEGIKWLNSFTDRKNGLLAQISKQYNIKPGSKKSAAAQMYAEGFYVNKNNEIVEYGEKELAIDFPDVKVQESIKGLANDPRIRQIYDETLNAINESRSRNLYPEIPRLDNYFLHFRAMEDTFSRLGLPFNPNDIRAKDLPTDLNGVTADLKPGQPYFASAMHREGLRTSFDLLGGLERYLSSAKNQIYHIDDIQTLRALRNYIADTYGQAKGLESLDNLSEEDVQERIKQVYGSHLSTFAKFLNEEANVLAGKTTLIDRGLEGIIGRRGITFLNTINGQVGSNMVGWNISSSLTNFLPVAQTLAKGSKVDFTKAFVQTVSSKIGSIFGKTDSFVENNPTIIRRKGAERFYRTPFQKIGDTGYVLMSAVDDISTELIVRTKYNELVRKGMSEQKASFEADKWVSRLMGDRSLGQQPQLYNSKILGLITKFQLEVRNQLDSQFYDTIQEAKVSNEEIENKLLRNAKTAAKVTSTFVQLAVVQHLYGTVFESIAGYNPAFDIVDVLIKALGFDDDEEDEDTVLDNIEEGFFALLEDLPYTSTFTGGRIPISSALPISEFVKGEDQYGNEKSRWDTIKEAAPYYLLPTGYGQIKKTTKGLEMFSDENPVTGSYTDSGNLRFPIDDTLKNRIQAGVFGQYASENARTYFDEGYAPLKEKQIQEYRESDMPIADYWKYREGLKDFKSQDDKVAYINGLDISKKQKDVLKSYLYDEEGYKKENPEKYAFLEREGIGFLGYKELDEDTQSAWSWAFKHQDEYEYYKQNGVLPGDYSTYYIPMLDFENEDNDAYSWAYDNPEKATFSKAITDNVVDYRKITKELYAIRADKDENGNSISGTAKSKKQEYIWSLDIDEAQKYILFKNEYNSYDDHNQEIVDYIISRDDLSYDERKTILETIGFTIDEDGTIRD